MHFRFLGLKELGKTEASFVKSITEEYCEKIDRDLFDSILVMQIKQYDVEGRTKKYSIHIRLESPECVLNSEASDWDLRRTLHKALKKLERGIDHKFKIEGQPQEKF